MKKKDIEWHIGCSGFHYSEWKGSFYPEGLPANKWFGYYTSQFNTLESNMTFYRLPLLSTLLKWHDESPADFSFSVKAPKLVTHIKRMQDVAAELEVFYDRMHKGLQEKLACVLFQLPPSYSCTPERLADIVSALNPAFNNVVEFRHTSWWTKEVYQQLKKNKITFCNYSHPKFTDDIVPASPRFYFRFHGAPVLYRSAYSHQYLNSIIEKIKADKKITKVYLYFNNTAGPAAIENARYIQNKL